MHIKGILPVLSDWLVFVITLISILWIYLHHLGRIKMAVTDSIFTLGIPIGVAVILSEGLSAIFDRARPFVADKEITLLVPHSADGGFPSHHMTVMVVIAASLWYRNRNLGYLLYALAIISGLARIGAGIHYPTDILAGLVIGWFSALIIHRFTRDQRLRLLRR